MKKILIVDDENNIRIELEKCLDKEEYYIEEARDFIIHKDYYNAKLSLKEAFIINSSNAKVYNLLGVIEECLGNKQLAKKYYRAALSLDPTYEPADNNLKRTVMYNSGIYNIDLG